MKRIIIIILTVLSLTAISAEPNQQGKTVTVPQEYLDSIEHAAALTAQQKAVAQEAVKESTDQLRSEMENRDNFYTTHVEGVVGLFGVLTTILVALAGILAPILINRRFEESIKEKINSHDKKIDEAQNKTNAIAQQVQDTAGKVEASLKTINDQIKEQDTRIKTVQEEFEKAKEAAQESAEKADEAKESAEKIAQSISYFNQAYNEKDLDKQIELYTKAIELNPNYAEAYNNRGVAYYDKGEFNKAIEDYNKAIELNPNDAEAYNNRGVAYKKKGDIFKAIEDYTKAIELNPNLAEAYNNIANAYLKIGELDQALTNADIAIKKDSQQASIFDTHAGIYIAMAEKETDKKKAKEYYQKAWDDCDTGLSLNPDEEVRKALEEKKQLCEERLKNL